MFLLVKCVVLLMKYAIMQMVVFCHCNNLCIINTFIIEKLIIGFSHLENVNISVDIFRNFEFL